MEYTLIILTLSLMPNFITPVEAFNIQSEKVQTLLIKQGFKDSEALIIKDIGKKTV